MDLKTKYNINDEVYFVDRDVKCDIIVEIKIEVYRSSTPTVHHIGVKYKLHVSGSWFTESQLFSTKEEVATEWLKKQGLTCGLKGGK